MTPLPPSTRLSYERAKGAMGTLSARADLLQTQVATGKKLQIASDDSVAYQRLQRIARADVNGKGWDANLDLSASLLAQADTTLASMTTQVQRASELMLRVNNNTLSATELKASGAELTAILDSMVELANATDTRGQPLFGGTDGAKAVTPVAGGGFTYSTGAPGAIPVGEDQDVVASELASRLFGLAGGKDTLAVLQALAAELSTGEKPADGDAAIADLQAADAQLATMRTSMGARATRVDFLQAQATEIATDREAERSGLEDVDATTALADLARTMTILSATQASFSKLSSLSLFDYLR